MIEWTCGSCRKKTKHRMKPTEKDAFSQYVILICAECGDKEMVPERVLESDEQVDYSVDDSTVGNDGGFDREVGSSCEGDGICPVR